MPIVLIIIGVLFMAAAVRGEHELLFSTLKDDFTGSPNFIYWGISLFIIAAIGNVKSLRPISSAFMTLVLIVIFLSNKGFAEKFSQQIGQSTLKG